MRPIETLLDELRVWVEHETPTHDASAVNRLSRHIEHELGAVGAGCTRIEGREGFGDHLVTESPWGAAEGPVVVLCHIDTVHPVGTIEDNPFRIEGDRAYGPGVYDMKGGAFMACEVLRSLAGRALAPKRKLVLLHTSDEEVGSPTSRDTIERLATGAHAVLVVEPARDGGKVVVARKGVARYVARFTGRPAHAGSRHADGRSAVRELARKVLEWEAMTDPATGLTVNVGMVRGGTAFNVVPETAVAYVDIRVPSPEIAATALARFEATTPDDPDVRLALEGGLNRQPFPVNAMTETLFARAAPFAKAHGFHLAGVHTGGGSDGNFTWDRAPTLDGLGVDGDGAHTKWEHVRVSSLTERGGFLTDLVGALLDDA